jgi:hypothetical protein
MPEAYKVTVKTQSRRGTAVPLRGTFEGIDVAYLGRDQDLGAILEVFDMAAFSKRGS